MFNRDDLARSLGEVAMAHGSLDMELRILFRGLMAPCRAANAVAREQDTMWLVKACERLLQENVVTFPSPWNKRVKKILNESKGDLQERNRMLHDMWSPGLQSNTYARMSAAGGSLPVVLKELTLNDIDGLAGKIRRVATKVGIVSEVCRAIVHELVPPANPVEDAAWRKRLCDNMEDRWQREVVGGGK